MGGKWTVPYGLYRAQFHYSGHVRHQDRRHRPTTSTALYRTMLMTCSTTTAPPPAA